MFNQEEIKVFPRGRGLTNKKKVLWKCKGLVNKIYRFCQVVKV